MKNSQYLRDHQLTVAGHYCDVLNRIIWKIQQSDPDKIASEATERLWYRAEAFFEIKWDADAEKFIACPI